MKSYTIESYKAGKKPMTRGGFCITDFHFFNGAKVPFRYMINGSADVIGCYPDGAYIGGIKNSEHDLFEAPVKREGCINLYRGGKTIYPFGAVHESEEIARKNIEEIINHVATIKIEWEE